MRTVRLGLEVAQQSPQAILPMTMEGILGGVLVLSGVFPASGTSAAAVAIFPFDVYFDLKQLLVTTPRWLLMVPLLVLALSLRAVVLAWTLSLATGGQRPLSSLWRPAARLATLACLVFLPAVVLIVTGVAIRYAPFVAVGALLGWAGATFLARRAVRLLSDSPARKRGPAAADVLFYGVALAVLAGFLSVLSGTGRLLPSLLLMTAGPLHALILLGWARTTPDAGPSGEGRVTLLVVATATVLLVGSAVFDRSFRTHPPSAGTDLRGTLALLGGSDSTSSTGALAEMDPRDLGIDRERVQVLSYRARGGYKAEDTHRDLDEVAAAVSSQIADLRAPVRLLGHSQASLILDRLEAGGLPGPVDSIELAPPPPTPPPVRVPAPGVVGTGRPAADLMRGFSSLLDRLGLPGFELDAPAAPPNLEPVIVADPATRRLTVWALADSLWLTGDWRRAGAIDIVAFTDHVGVTNNPRSLDAARDHLAGATVADDGRSWRGAIVAGLRYLFEPWKPEVRH